MTVYNTAYDTTVCKNFRMQKTMDAIKEARLRDWLPATDGVLRVESTTGASAVIPQFNHPLYIGKHSPDVLKTSPDEQLDVYLAVDVRPSGRYDPVNNKFKVTNSTVYNSRIVRAALNAVWLAQGPKATKQLAPTALGVFANWISETIGHRFGLDPKSVYTLTILAGIFYASNHHEGLEFNKADENRSLAGIANALRYNIADVIDVYEQTKLIVSTEDFCKKAVQVLNNVRMSDFNDGVLVALMGSTWFGDNAKENIGVALEHPPTWLAIIYEAYTNTMMKKTAIARICERRSYKDGLDLLVRSMRTFAPALHANSL